MKILKLLIAIAICGFMTTSCSNEQIDSVIEEAAINDSSYARSNGNYAPTGKHYNLNIIGMSKEKTADMTGDNGHRIFVKLWGQTKIMLIEGDDFAVLDANGTDGRAEFQLPNPDPDGDGTSSYSIWLRALGKPGGKAVITTCADADLTTEYYEVCSAEYVEVESTRGPAKFENVSRTLLTIYVDADFTFTDGDGNEVTIKKGRYTIFDPIFEDYFWKYDNQGLRLLQMRFYEMDQDIS
jgi:hypothetical protein